MSRTEAIQWVLFLAFLAIMVAVVTYLPISLPGRQTVPSDTRRSDFFWWYWLVTSVILIYAILFLLFEDEE
jgi:hypothetical protein